MSDSEIDAAELALLATRVSQLNRPDRLRCVIIGALDVDVD